MEKRSHRLAHRNTLLVWRISKSWRRRGEQKLGSRKIAFFLATNGANDGGQPGMSRARISIFGIQPCCSRSAIPANQFKRHQLQQINKKPHPARLRQFTLADGFPAIFFFLPPEKTSTSKSLIRQPAQPGCRRILTGWTYKEFCHALLRESCLFPFPLPWLLHIPARRSPAALGTGPAAPLKKKKKVGAWPCGHLRRQPESPSIRNDSFFEKDPTGASTETKKTNGPQD